MEGNATALTGFAQNLQISNPVNGFGGTVVFAEDPSCSGNCNGGGINFGIGAVLNTTVSFTFAFTDLSSLKEFLGWFKNTVPLEIAKGIKDGDLSKDPNPAELLNFILKEAEKKLDKDLISEPEKEVEGGRKSGFCSRVNNNHPSCKVKGFKFSFLK